ncbi:unnamed protein product [Effrenium voratum]|nr:unnamed protein product [Effrenium voratum]
MYKKGSEALSPKRHDRSSPPVLPSGETQRIREHSSNPVALKSWNECPQCENHIPAHPRSWRLVRFVPPCISQDEQRLVHGALLQQEGRSRTIEKKLADRAIQQERDLMLQQNRVKAAQNRVSVTDYRKRQQFEAMREKQLSAQVQRETSQAIMHQKRQIDMEMRKTNSERAAMIQISQKEARSRASQERSARLERVREFQEYERQQAEQEVLEAESTLPELEEQELICLQRLQNSRIVTQSVLEELETRLGSQSSVATLLRSKQRSTDQLESVGGLSTGLPQEPEAAQLDDAGTAGEATGQPVEPITEPVAA